MLTSLLGGSAFGHPWTRLWNRIIQGRRQARRRAAVRQVSTTRIELLETRVLLTDFGDAPLPYPVTTAENGAQHAEVGLTLGSSRDGEADGAHSANASGDDTASDDEDGVTFPATIRVGDLGVQITINVQGITTTGKLDAWIDFNGDGSWGGPGEQVANNKVVVNGNNTLSIDVPAGAKAGTTYARFRLSSAGNLGVKGAAADGEVEDYAVVINNPIISTGAFGTRNIVTSGSGGTQSAFAADIDGDGDMDLLSASRSNNEIAWYQNDGTPLNGGWAARSISTAASYPEAVFAIDLDGDGDLDVLSASRYDDKVAWYENDGTPASGAWTEHSVSTAVNAANSLYAADMDGDGDIDVLATATYDNKVVWLENNGSQSFTLRDVTSSASQSISVFAADMDRDGDMDIVSASVGDNKVAWYENNGSQSFTARTIITSSIQPNSVYVADIDRDGDMDVAVASFSDNKVAWVENDGTPANGGWVAHTITTTSNGAVFVVVADMDGDGDMDLLSADSTANSVSWHRNDGSQNFTSITVSSLTQSPQVVVAADVDQDGDLDVVAGSYADNTISFFENLNDNTPPATTSFVLQTPSGSTTNADSLTFRVTFSEAVLGVGAADFVATGTTASLSVSTVSSSVYDVTLTGGDLAGLNGSVGLNFAASPTITDLYSNALPATEPATDQTYTVDNTAPGTTSFLMQNPTTSPTSANTLVFRVTFTEPVTGVDASDFTPNGTTATVSVATVSSSVYDITLTGGTLPSLNGTVNLNLSSTSAITDLAGNSLPRVEPATDDTYTVDNAAPSTTSFVLQSPAAATTNADSLTFRVTFSEGVTGVAAGDFAASGTTATLSVNAVSSSVYDITLTGGNLGSLNGTVGLNFNSPTINDLAGNALPATEPSTDQTFTVDNTAPVTTSFVRQTPAGTATNANSVTFRVTFGEAVTGVDAADFIATGTTATTSVATVSTTVYDVTLTGGNLADVNGIVGLNFNSPSIADLAGNALPSTEPATDQTFTLDNTAPATTSFTLQNPSGSTTNANTLVFRVTFSEAVTGVDAADFAIAGTNASASVTSVDAATYDVTLTGGNLASLNGVVGLNFATSPSITDLAGNNLPNTEPAIDQTWTIDNTAPSTTSFVRQTPAGSTTNSDTLTFRVTFSEPVINVGAADFIASGSTAGISVTSVSTSEYDVTLSGGNLSSLNGTVGLNFAVAASITDLAGNALPSTEPATDQTFTLDNTAPSTTSFVLQSPAGGTTNANTLVFRVTFSEAVAGVDAADFAIAGTTATASVTSVDASTYDVTISGGNLATLNGVVGLNYAASPSITDLAGNNLPNTEPAIDFTWTVDNTAPSTTSFVRQTPGNNPTNSDTLTFRVTFSEPVMNVGAADFMASGTTAGISVATVSTSEYDVTLSGGNLSSLNGTVALDFAVSASIIDVAGNALPGTEPATDQTFTVDNTAPTLAITPNGTTTNSSLITFVFQFSETVTGFVASDISVGNGTKGLFTAIDGDTYSLAVTPVSDGAVTINVGASAATDVATNGSVAASASVNSDRTASTLSITPNGILSNATSTTFTFQFSAAVTGFDVNDVVVANGTKGGFTVVDGDTYTLVISAVADGIISVDVGAGVAFDGASNGNTAASASIVSDRTAPSLVITPQGTLTNAATTTFTFQFSEAVNGFDASDIVVTNGTKGNFAAVDGDTYTLAVTPDADGLVSVTVNAVRATDDATNGNTSATASITSDRTVPTLNITPQGTLTNAAATLFTFQFSETVTGFDVGDINVTNGTPGTLVVVDGDTYQLSVTPLADGVVSVGVNSNRAADAANNGNTAATASITSDRTAPVVTITPDAILTNAAATVFTFQFSEPVTGFDVDDIRVTNGNKGLFTAVDADTYTLAVSPVGDGVVAVSISDNMAIDAATNGNLNAAASITSDRTAPSLVISPDAILTNAAETTFTFQFSEPVTGFDASDISLTNGNMGDFTSVDDDTYTLVVSPASDGVVTISVIASKAIDAATNGNQAATATIDSDRTAPILTITPSGTLTSDESVLFTFQFSELVTNFDISDVSVINGTVGLLTAVDGDTFTLAVSPTTDGSVSVSVSGNAAIDAASNGSLAASAAITSDRSGPVITTGTAVSVAENTTTVQTIAATDAHGPVTYSISGGADAGKFLIDATTGALQFAVAPDFESSTDSDHDNGYAVTVTATDSLGQSTSQSLTVTVTPVNDNAPAFATAATFQANENAVAVGTVGATDADAPVQAVTFAITGGLDAALFSISPTGVLTFKSAPDFEVAGDSNGDHVYELQITADDGQGLQTTQSVTVTLIDVAEAPQLLSNGEDVTWTKPRPLAAGAVLSSVVVVGNGTLAGGTLTIRMNAVGSRKKPKDLLTIPTSPAIGQSSGLIYADQQLTMQIQLGENVSEANIQAVLRGITFLTKGKGLKIPTRVLKVTLTKADGLSDSLEQTIHVRKKA